MKINNKKNFFYALLFFAFIIELGLIFSIIKGYTSTLSFLLISLANFLTILVAILNIRKLTETSDVEELR
ncbi:hypothetical protein ACS126_01915 [Sphingobacterium lactis]|uniref:hypothetical protein n=1 Tax=Sphingobacterium lactis TaxID=797291 RepID=UPI003EC80C01